METMTPRKKRGGSRPSEKIRPLSAMLLIVLAVACFPGHGFSMNLFNPTGLGMRFVMARQAGDPNGGTGIGPGAFFSLRYREPSNVFYVFGSGFYTAMDGSFKMDRFKTICFPSFEFQVGQYFGKSPVWSPGLYGGLNFYGAFDKRKIVYSNGTSRINAGDRFYQVSGFAGGSLEYQPNYLYSIYIGADYRYVFWAEDHSSRRYIVMQIGFLFYQ
jgi:hypothetical protein